MKNIPDNVVYDKEKLKYDAFIKPYPTTLSSPDFEKPTIQKISKLAISIFKTKFKEINIEYEDFLTNVEYNELVYSARYNFKPIPGQEYYLYKKINYNFLSIISPKEWNQEYIGSFVLMSNDIWKKNK